ncbi:MAG: c-type cytochrome [Micropruina sp.]
MRFLTAKRRRRPARPALLVLALLLMGALYAAVAPAARVSADNGNSQQVAEGKALFQVTCSSCHGMNGEGTGQGPSLIGVGAAAVDFQVSTGRMPMANPGAQAPRKYNIYSASEIAALSAYVATLGPGPGIPTSEQYSGEGLSAEELARGGELFRTNCSACHNFEGNGGALPNGKYAPSLKGVDGKHIWEALRTGPQQMPVFNPAALPDQDVREIVGYLETLHAQPGSGLTFGGFGPVSEGLFAWIIGIGGLCLIAVWIAAKGARAR